MTNKYNNRLLAILSFLGLIALLTLVSMPPEGHRRYDLPACPTEDSDNCYWDADVRGNGQGHSFFNIDGVIYLEVK